MQPEQLPVYPSNIQGELRLILQNKDLFLLCYKYLEDYRKLSDEQNQIITKEFIEQQLKIGLEEIDELRIGETHAEKKLGLRMKHNETLLGQLSIRGMATVGDGNPRKNICRSPNFRKCRAIIIPSDEKNRDLSLFDNIAMAIEEIQRELKDKLKPLCEFFRDLFYLQLHFSLVLTQICNYCMPLVTENIGLIDRIFFWADRPEFELVKKSSEISDRLKDIYTRTQSVLTLLVENVMFIQNKVELQRNLEKKFQERLEVQQIEKDQILRKIHFSRQDLDLMDEENDRLVGVLVKLDPKFVDTKHFNELAEFSVRRNYLEGRLTPDGFQNRQYTLNTPQIHLENIKSLFSNTNENSSENRNIKNENLSNRRNGHSSKTKPKKKRSHSKKKDKENVNENSIIPNKPFKEKRHISNKYETMERETIKKGNSKVSIKDKLLNKTKGIFDSAFKRPSKHKNNDNYVKVFEGELLAELSRFTPLCQTPVNIKNSWDCSNGNNSMERSLKRRYDLREDQLHDQSSQPIKISSGLKFERQKKTISSSRQ